MDSRFYGNDTNVIVVIPAEAGIHPMQESFPHYLPKSQLLPDPFFVFPAKTVYLYFYNL
jgi:hypothetical protein